MVLVTIFQTQTAVAPGAARRRANRDSAWQFFRVDFYPRPGVHVMTQGLSAAVTVAVIPCQ